MNPALSFIEYVEYGRINIENVGLEFPEKNERLNNYTHVLAHTIMLFIICHEQAHHELEHTIQLQKRMLSDGLQKELKTSREKELAADRLAADLFFRCATKQSAISLFSNLEEKIHSPFLLFILLSIVERRFPKPATTNPSSVDRFDNLVNVYRRSTFGFHDDYRGQLQQYIDILYTIWRRLNE